MLLLPIFVYKFSSHQNKTSQNHKNLIVAQKWFRSNGPSLQDKWLGITLFHWKKYLWNKKIKLFSKSIKLNKTYFF